MYSAATLLGNRRLGIFADTYSENSFVLRNAETVFARINKIGSKWVVWFYKKHLQKEFCKLKEAVAYVNEDFINWVGNKK